MRAVLLSNMAVIKRKINKLDLSDRIKVIMAYEETNNYCQIASEFKCSIHQIRNIVQNKASIMKRFNIKESRQDSVNSQVINLIEMVLYEWFQRAQQHIESGPITNEILMKKAREIKRIFCVKHFSTDLEWLKYFRTKYNITDLDMSLLLLRKNKNPNILDLDLNTIAGYVMDNNPILENLELNAQESPADLPDSGIEVNDNQRGSIFPYVIEVSDSDSEESTTKTINEAGKPDETSLQNGTEQATIANNDDAKQYLKRLEDYALMSENFRAIGLIEKIMKEFEEPSSN